MHRDLSWQPYRRQALEAAGQALYHTRKLIMNWTLQVVVVPVTDVDQAKDFYSRLGAYVSQHQTPLQF
jgi:hypothetical protein